VSGFLLDTNVLSEFARALPADRKVDAWLKATPPELLFSSVLTFAEILRGIELLPVGKRRTELEVWHGEIESAFARRLIVVSPAIANRWAILSAQAQRRGTPLAIVDGLIAATALEQGLTLVTRNVKDFAGLGVAVFNPWGDSAVG
jgi:toxin FitB